MSCFATREELLMGGMAGMDIDTDMVVDKEFASMCSQGVWPPIF
jgi:hypothetical protein